MNGPSTLRILWFAYVSTLLVFGGIAFFIPREAGDGVPYFLHVVPAVGCAVASFVVPGTLVRQAKAGQAPAAVAQTAFILKMALIEAVALFGFVDAWLTGDGMRYLPFGAVAFFLQVLAFPADTDSPRSE